jgi:hypothetical protein
MLFHRTTLVAYITRPFQKRRTTLVSSAIWRPCAAGLFRAANASAASGKPLFGLSIMKWVRPAFRSSAKSSSTTVCQDLPFWRRHLEATELFPSFADGSSASTSSTSLSSAGAGNCFVGAANDRSQFVVAVIRGFPRRCSQHNPNSVNRLPNLTPDRRPILTPLSDGFGR